LEASEFRLAVTIVAGPPGAKVPLVLEIVNQVAELERVQLKDAVPTFVPARELAKIDYQAIRNLFLNPPAKKGITPSWGEPKPDALRAYLVDEHSFSAERVDSAIKRIAGKESSKTETLEKWFG